MKLSKYVSDLVVNEQKVIYLIFFLPISLFVGSLVTNITILLIIFFFFYEIKKKNHLSFLKKKEFFILVFLSIYLLINALFIGKNTESFIRAFGFLRFVFLVLNCALRLPRRAVHNNYHLIVRWLLNTSRQYHRLIRVRLREVNYNKK